MIKKLFILAISFACLQISCKKDGDGGKNTPGNNTWQLTPDGGLGTEVYKLKTIVLRTNIKQELEANSEDNAAGGINGINSTIILSFPTVGPPPSGTYKITSYEKLTATDQVAISVQTWGSPGNGLTPTIWRSQEGGNYTVFYKFENGKANAVFQDIPVRQNGSAGPATGITSANISQ